MIKSKGNSLVKKKDRYAVPQGGQNNLYENFLIQFARKEKEKEWKEKEKERKKRKEKKRKEKKRKEKKEKGTKYHGKRIVSKAWDGQRTEDTCWVTCITNTKH